MLETSMHVLRKFDIDQKLSLLVCKPMRASEMNGLLFYSVIA